MLHFFSVFDLIRPRGVRNPDLPHSVRTLYPLGTPRRFHLVERIVLKVF